MIPPRRPSVKRLLVPRDATETARQGQGIGDIEAMRQMATTAIPEVLRNAPATSTAMGLYDTGKAALAGDKMGMALGAVSMLPVGRAASRLLKALPMDEASRMARAAEMGYTIPVYHGTASDFAYPAFKMRGGGVMHEIPSAHVGTDVAATQRVMALEGLDEPPPLVSTDLESGPRVMELLMKAKKPFYGFKADPARASRPLNEPEIANLAGLEFAAKYGRLPKRTTLNEIKESTQLLRKRLLDEGYDVVPYINAFEDRGSTSYMVLRPENLRLKGAAFDPAKASSGNLMASLAGILGVGAASKYANSRQPEQQ